MNCGQYQEKFTDLINHQLPADEREKLELHLAGCIDCQHELAELKQMWDLMGEMEQPEPSAHLKVKFDAMLKMYKEQQTEKVSVWDNIIQQISRLWEVQPKLSLSYSLVLIVLCLGGGYWYLHPAKAASDEQLQALTKQVHELKQTMTLALLENPSASERIRAVSYTSEMKHADKEVIDALLATLNNDPNVNVRLSTLDALAQMANHPEVREGLIQSIVQQDSPLMQSAIADVMLKLQEKRSVTPLKQLLKQKNLDNSVRDKISKTITQLI